MNTQTTLAERFGTARLDHLEDLDVQVLTGLQRQGDVMIAPMRDGQTTGLEQVKPEGLIVVRGENGGNTHLLLAEGDVQFAPRDDRATPNLLGILKVLKGAVAWLTHPEHGYMGIGEGTYTVRRQREQADAIRLVAD